MQATALRADDDNRAGYFHGQPSDLPKLRARMDGLRASFLAKYGREPDAELAKMVMHEQSLHEQEPSEEEALATILEMGPKDVRDQLDDDERHARAFAIARAHYDSAERRVRQGGLFEPHQIAPFPSYPYMVDPERARQFNEKAKAIKIANEEAARIRARQEVEDALRRRRESVHGSGAGSSPRVDPIPSTKLAIRTNELRPGLRAWTMIGDALVEVEVIHLRDNGKGKQKTALVKRVDTGTILPKGRTAASLRRRPAKFGYDPGPAPAASEIALRPGATPAPAYLLYEHAPMGASPHHPQGNRWTAYIDPTGTGAGGRTAASAPIATAPTAKELEALLRAMGPVGGIGYRSLAAQAHAHEPASAAPEACDTPSDAMAARAVESYIQAFQRARGKIPHLVVGMQGVDGRWTVANADDGSSVAAFHALVCAETAVRPTRGRAGAITPMAAEVAHAAARRNPTAGFPVGARVYVNGADEAIVLQHFPEGSSSYGFPHYRLRMVNGDKDVAIAEHRVDATRTFRGNVPPGGSNQVPCSDAKAMVVYLPYIGTPYDVGRKTSGSIEICFASVAEGRAFYQAAVASGHVEKAELREDAKGHARGRLIDEWTDGAREQNPSETVVPIAARTYSHFPDWLDDVREALRADLPSSIDRERLVSTDLKEHGRLREMYEKKVPVAEAARVLQTPVPPPADETGTYRGEPGVKFPAWWAEGAQVRVKATPHTRKFGLRAHGGLHKDDNRVWPNEVGTVRRKDGASGWVWSVHFARGLEVQPDAPDVLKALARDTGADPTAPPAPVETPLATPRTKGRTIVVAWLTPGFEIVKPGRPDLGVPPTTKPTLEAKSLVWMNEGTDEDLAKAEAYARTAPMQNEEHQRTTVFAYPTTEPMPLERARLELLAKAKEPYASITSTPRKPINYIIREEREPLSPTGIVWRAQQADGAPAYAAEPSREAIETRLRADGPVGTIQWIPMGSPATGRDDPALTVGGFTTHGFAVAGAVARPHTDDQTHLTHSINFAQKKVLCGRVKFASILDDTEIVTPEPTCDVCRARLQALREGRVVITKPPTASAPAPAAAIATDLNANERTVAAALRALGEATLNALAATAFPALPAEKANSWTRNSLRKLRALGLAVQAARGAYRAG